MHSLTVLIFLAILFTGNAFASSEPPQKRNVLFISVDDMNAIFSTYGHHQVKTPHLDKLAKDGTLFERAYCQFTLCSPSRSSLLTGQRPDTTQVFDLKRHFRKALPDVVTLPQLFKNNGYYVARVGKIYHFGNPTEIGTNGLDDEPSWNERINPIGIDKKEEPQVINFTKHRGIGGSMSYLVSKGSDEEHTDGLVAQEAIQLLETHKDEPFFIAAGFYRPHAPYIAPKKYFDMYPLDSIPDPDTDFEHLKNVPKPALASNQPWPWFGVSKEEFKLCLQAYWASITFVDAQIGKVIDALDRLGLRENTLIVFWSDHGYHIGDHGLFQKVSLFENCAQVPLILSSPFQKQKGKPSRRIVELIDLYPTMAEFAKLTPPDNLPGASLLGLMDDPNKAWNRPAFTQVWRNTFPGYSVRTERYRYTEWNFGKNGAELYDYQTDPEEKNNLIKSPHHRKVIEEHQKLIQKNWENPYLPNKKS